MGMYGLNNVRGGIFVKTNINNSPLLFTYTSLLSHAMHHCCICASHTLKECECKYEDVIPPSPHLTPAPSPMSDVPQSPLLPPAQTSSPIQIPLSSAKQNQSPVIYFDPNTNDGFDHQSIQNSPPLSQTEQYINPSAFNSQGNYKSNK